MKFSAATTSILKNFANINNTIVIDPGNTVATMAVDRTIIAVATVPDEFSQTFGIYDLPRFLSIMSLFKEPEIKFSSTKQAQIIEGSRIVNYTFAEPSILTKAKTNIKDLDVIATFEMTSDILNQLQKASSVIGLDRIRFRGNGESLYVGAFDSQSATNDTFNIEVGETDQEFDIHLKVEYLRLIPGAYNVDISKFAVKFSSLDFDLKYWLAIEKSSKI